MAYHSIFNRYLFVVSVMYGPSFVIKKTSNWLIRKFSLHKKLNSANKRWKYVFATIIFFQLFATTNSKLKAFRQFSVQQKVIAKVLGNFRETELVLYTCKYRSNRRTVMMVKFFLPLALSLHQIKISFIQKQLKMYTHVWKNLRQKFGCFGRWKLFIKQCSVHAHLFSIWGE
jgi:hypothetical protein